MNDCDLCPEEFPRLPGVSPELVSDHGPCDEDGPPVRYRRLSDGIPVGPVHVRCARHGRMLSPLYVQIILNANEVP